MLVQITCITKQPLWYILTQLNSFFPMSLTLKIWMFFHAYGDISTIHLRFIFSISLRECRIQNDHILKKVRLKIKVVLGQKLSYSLHSVEIWTNIKTKERLKGLWLLQTIKLSVDHTVNQIIISTRKYNHFQMTNLQACSCNIV